MRSSFHYISGRVLTNVLGLDFIRNPIRDTLCPFRHFGIQVDFTPESISCFKQLVSDKMCFHAILLMSSASDDLVSQRQLSNTSRYHLHRTLLLLNNRLSESNAHTDDLILYVVGILASISILFNDYHAASMHSAGIAKIVRLRGGIRGRSFGSAVQLSIDRYRLLDLIP